VHVTFQQGARSTVGVKGHDTKKGRKKERGRGAGVSKGLFREPKSEKGGLRGGRKKGRKLHLLSKKKRTLS